MAIASAKSKATCRLMPVLILLSTSCTTYVPISTEAERLTGDPLIVELIAPYAVGNFSNYMGGHERDGAAMASADLNNSGGVLGRPVQLQEHLFLEHFYSVETGCSSLSESAAAELSEISVQENSVVIMASSCVAQAAGSIFADANTLEIVVQPNSREFFDRPVEENASSYFQLVLREEEEAEVVSDFLADQYRNAKIAILAFGTEALGSQFAWAVKRRLNELGIQEHLLVPSYIDAEFMVDNSFRPNDFTQLIERLRTEEIDVIVFNSFYWLSDVNFDFLSQLRREEFSALTILGGTTAQRSERLVELYEELGPDAEGILSPLSDPCVDREIAAIAARFMRDCSPRRIYSYAAVQLWAAAAEAAGTLETDAIAASLRNTSIDTVLGALSFDGVGNPTTSLYRIYVWREGALSPL